MDRINISRIQLANGDEMIQVQILPGWGKKYGPQPIYEGLMTPHEFGRCITNLSDCEIKTLKIKEINVD